MREDESNIDMLPVFNQLYLGRYCGAQDKKYNFGDSLAAIQAEHLNDDNFILDPNVAWKLLRHTIFYTRIMLNDLGENRMVAMVDKYFDEIEGRAA